MELPDRFYFVTKRQASPIYMASFDEEANHYCVWAYPRNPLDRYGTHRKPAVGLAIENGYWRIVDTTTNEGASLLLEEGAAL